MSFNPIFLFFLGLTLSFRIDYTNVQLFQAKVDSNTLRIDYSNVQLVQAKVDSNTLRSMMVENIDIWRSVQIEPNLYQVDFLCDKFSKNKIVGSLNNITVLDPSLGRTIRHEREEILKIKKKLNNSSKEDFFATFRPYEEWEAFYVQIVQTYPEFVKQIEIGRTFEDRPIIGFSITSPTGTNKPEIYLEALQHAREWLAPTSLMWTTIKMLEGYRNNDTDAKFLLDNIFWTVVPIVNIDGYIYSWNVDRFWRKNRRLNNDGSYGVDLNRNWGPLSTWCTSGSSKNTRSDTYCGTSPFSEPETQYVSNFINSKKGKIKAGIDFHTYGPLILWPWQYTYEQLPPNDYQMFENLGGKLETEIRKIHGEPFISEQGSDLYPHSGGFIDFNWEENGIVSFTLEGRGGSFVVPSSSIVPSGEESYAGVLELAHFVIDG